MTTINLDTPAPQPEPASGADLARIAFQAARLAAKNRGNAPAKPSSVRSRRKPLRGDGREPMSFAAALTALMESRGWQAPAAGGTLTDRWPAIAPELAGHVQVGRFDTESGTLELVPASPAYATQLRLSSGALVTRINNALGDGQDQQQGTRCQVLVRSIRVLAPGTVPAGQADTEPAEAVVPAEPGTAHTRQDASAGYHQALAAHRAKKEEQGDGLAPAVRAAVELQGQVLRARREPEEVFGNGRTALEQLRAKSARQAPVDDARARALQRLAAERAGRVSAAPAVRRTA